MNEAHFNELSPAEAERLAVLMEEMADAQQVIGKILRHGYESFHPNDPKTTNRSLLEKRLGYIEATVLMMAKVADVHSQTISDHAEQHRFRRGFKYLHHH